MGIRIPQVRSAFQWPKASALRQQSATNYRKVRDQPTMEPDNEEPKQPKARIRNIDWRQVLREADRLGPEFAVCVGEVDQSIRTHIRKGRFAYIDPDKYEVWTRGAEGSRTRASLYLRRKA